MQRRSHVKKFIVHGENGDLGTLQLKPSISEEMTARYGQVLASDGIIGEARRSVRVREHVPDEPVGKPDGKTQVLI
jgi:hypothetical protein